MEMESPSAAKRLKVSEEPPQEDILITRWREKRAANTGWHEKCAREIPTLGVERTLPPMSLFDECLNAFLKDTTVFPFECLPRIMKMLKWENWCELDSVQMAACASSIQRLIVFMGDVLTDRIGRRIHDFSESDWPPLRQIHVSPSFLFLRCAFLEPMELGKSFEACEGVLEVLRQMLRTYRGEFDAKSKIPFSIIVGTLIPDKLAGFSEFGDPRNVISPCCDRSMALSTYIETIVKGGKCQFCDTIMFQCFGPFTKDDDGILSLSGADKAVLKDLLEESKDAAFNVLVAPKDASYGLNHALVQIRATLGNLFEEKYQECDS